MKRNNLILLVLILAIGFAAVSTTPVLNGTLNIGENTQDFDVYFSKSLEDGVENNKLIKDDTHLEFTKDMSLVGDTYTLEYDVTNGSRNYDAEITINCTKSNEYLSVTNEFDTSEYLLATETRRGTLTIEVLKPYVGTESEPTKDISITCEIVGNAVERDSLGEGTPADKVKQSNWTMTDNDNNGEVSQGDLITLGSESFYVYDIEEDNVKAIAKYNLLVDGGYNVTNPTGLQDSTALGNIWGTPIGAVSFTTDGKYEASKEVDGVTLNKNDYSISTIKDYVDEYAEKLAALDSNITNVRLITKEELDKVGCYSSYDHCSFAPSYIYSTAYWTSSASSDGYYVKAVSSKDRFKYQHYTQYNSFGVRPVIIISKSLF